MSLVQEDQSSYGLLLVGLDAWASLMFAMMVVKSYIAGNSQWVSILSGMIFICTAISVYIWRSLVLENREVMENRGEYQ
ncbi:hypothetical protein [Desulfosporosinus meridiei]|uniref:Uncharacterized protein n=1 Tax=Desulfosporosinus meridiei (strain ATCC BAA-275 / DSM 13257 / KCTC 12902 / NCIMB 13706 / S10) TaxID=768704 RepID=J7J2Y7_DESMD|nr:hypothetical protein [Desulfosporosinus meridiei]AFQ45311.1 hypothetical protein Desmer_3462 [Desulfosporosinus meridiei DSM 13257]